MFKRFIPFLTPAVLAACMLIEALPSAAEEPSIPQYWDEKERLPRPGLAGFERIRFLTSTDFPPFNFIDADGRLAGFHVELVRAICRELDIVARCQIQGLPWDELDGALRSGQGEALIAGTAVTAANRATYAFSRPYLRFPARFIAPKTSAIGEPMHRATAGRRIGVMAGSAHEAMLRTYFPAARAVPFAQANWLFDAVREGKVDGAFGDGMRLSFWLAGEGSANCCRFVGGPYEAPEFLGLGLAIAVRRDQAVLAQAFDYALREIDVKGTFAELYLKYFPISFY